MVGYQWNIFWVNLDHGIGSEQIGRRPVLVISNEDINEVLPIVTVLAITSLKDGRRVYPNETLLTSENSMLDRDSLVLGHQIRTISKERLEEKIGQVQSDAIKEKIRKAVRIHLDL